MLIIAPATSHQQIYEKFDYSAAYRVKPTVILALEVKDEKFALRSDPEPDHNRLLIEFKNIYGYPGWSMHDGPLLQRRYDEYYQYERAELRVWAKENSLNEIDMAYPKDDNEYPETWKIYRRKSEKVIRKDAFVFAPYKECEHLRQAVYPIPKACLDIEQKFLAAVKAKIESREWKLEYDTYAEVNILLQVLWNEMFGERVWEK